MSHSSCRSLVLTPPVAGDSPDVSPVYRMPDTAASYAISGDDDLLSLRTFEGIAIVTPAEAIRRIGSQ